MAGVARIPRRRGGLCGLLLIVLGAWGALIPFIGPYFNFAYSPDKAWAYTSGRLYLSILPGAAAVLGGLLVLGTRSRTAGMFGGLLAAVGGAWFIVGAGVVATVLKQSSITTGSPLIRAGSGIGSVATYVFLEELGFFVGIGVLTIFFGALAMGRFSMLSARDAANVTGDQTYSATSGQPAGLAENLPAGSTTSTGQFPASTGPYSTSTGPFPASGEQYGGTKPFPGDEPTQTQARFPASTSQFPTSPSGRYPDSTSTPPFPPEKD
jgi:hypothetical protein